MKKWLAFIFTTLILYTQTICSAQSIEKDSVYSVFLHIIVDETNEPIAEAQVRVEGSDGTIIETISDQKGNCNIINLNEKNIYRIDVSVQGCYTEKYKIKQYDSCAMNAVIDFRLVPLAVKPTLLPIFTFKKGSAKMYDNHSEDIFIIGLLMKENPTISISISGHCDPRERKTLAKKRAERIYQLLLQSGVDSNRLAIDSLSIKQSVIRYSHQGCREVPNMLYVSKSFLRHLPPEQRKNIKIQCREVRISIASTNYSPKENK